MTEENNIKRQMILYLIFAALMIGLNYLIQKLNQIAIAPLICEGVGSSGFLYTFYCSTNPYDMPELIGSIAAVGITYIIKFFLDKFIADTTFLTSPLISTISAVSMATSVPEPIAIPTSA